MTGTKAEAAKPGLVAAAGEKFKRDRYGASVVPFSMELDGRFGDAAANFITRAAGACRGASFLLAADEHFAGGLARSLALLLQQEFTLGVADLLVAGLESSAFLLCHPGGHAFTESDIDRLINTAAEAHLD